MKNVKGKSPYRENIRGNSDCVFFEQADGLIPVVGEHVHAIRCYDSLSIGSIMHNVMYVKPTVGFKIKTLRKVPLTLPEEVVNDPEYTSFPEHLAISNIELYNIRYTESTDTSEIGAIAFTYNDNVVMFYLPSYNSFVCGNLGWHEHYITLFLQNVWPQITAELNLEKIDNAIIQDITKKKVEVLIGCDPEFELTKNNRVLKADRHIHVTDMYHGPIGVDGASAQIEIRPKPGTPAQVTRNIKKLIKTFSSDYEEYDLSTVGNKYPLGGHIHVGIGTEYSPDRDLISLLDHFVGSATIEMSGTARSEYKHLGKCRSQPHGFEYRTPPGSVFMNPGMAFITMKIVKNICEKYFNEGEIEYDDSMSPVVQDYVNVCGLTKKQAEYFLNTCRNYTPTKSMRASWKMPPAVKKATALHPVELKFTDGWSEYVRNSIANEFEEFETSIKDISICFYMITGIDSACTLCVEGFDLYGNGTPVIENGILEIGISRNFAEYGMTVRQYRNLGSAIRNIITSFEDEE